jgi:hypothetical protein
MKSKRGSESLSMQAVITLIFVVILFSVLVLFLVDNATGNLAKKQILAKQLCLVLIDAKPGTSITVHFNGIIEKKQDGTGFLIKKDKTDVAGYYYPCYKNTKDFDVYPEGKNTNNFIININ